MARNASMQSLDSFMHSLCQAKMTPLAVPPTPTLVASSEHDTDSDLEARDPELALSICPYVEASVSSAISKSRVRPFERPLKRSSD